MEKYIELICEKDGGQIIFEPGEKIKRCRYCDTVYIRPEEEADASLTAIKHADELRLDGEFETAETSYHRYLDTNVKDYNARWGLLLCRYGVIYEPNSKGEFTATCRRHNKNQYILSDSNYARLLESVPPDEKDRYEIRAKQIDEIHREIDRLEEEKAQGRAKDWEIILCFRDGETAETRLARGLYDELKKKYTVFYPPEALRGKNEFQAEAAVSVAVESAKMMLVIGFGADAFADPWVHMLYARFKQRIQGTEKTLIPIFIKKSDLHKDISSFSGFSVDERKPDAKALVNQLSDSLLKTFTVRCPECQSPLTRFDGRVGYCPAHHWVAPKGSDDEMKAEAEARNRKDEEEEKEKKKREEEARLRKEEDKRKRAEARRKAVKRAALAVVALACAGAFCFYWFTIRPEMNYSQAGTKFALGDYETARQEYSALGNYKDALARVVLCDAMTDLQAGRTEDTVKKLDQLTADGMEEITRQLADALRSVISGWRAKGVTPGALLLLLTKADIIDPEGTLNIQALRVEGHTALLDGGMVASYTADMNGDGDPELVALDSEYHVTVYRMAPDKNVRMAMDSETLAACQLRFAEQLRETDEDAAFACCAEAYRLAQNEETRSDLVAAYRRRAAARETVQDIQGALSDAENALALSGAGEDFSLFYELNRRISESAPDTAGKIAAWERFGADQGAVLARFQAVDQWKRDAAALRLAYAAQLAQAKDGACVEELRAAYELGADISAAIDGAAADLGPGLTLISLRLLGIETAGDGAAAETARAQLAGEVRTAISQWKSLNIAARDVPALIRLADEQQISLEGISRTSLYREAALAAAGSPAQSTFGDWDGDGWEELLALDGEGTLRFFGMAPEWGVLSAMETGLPGGALAVVNQNEPLILLLSQRQDELLAVNIVNNQLRFLFREAGISRYAVENGRVTFSRALEGSIPRYVNYVYEPVNAADKPERTGVDWQGDSYPLPETAGDAVLRYLEAAAYHIPEEEALLSGDASAFPFFRLDGSGLLPGLQVPVSVSAAPYCELDHAVLLKVDYTAGNTAGQIWAAVENKGGWKVTGFSDSFADRPLALPEEDDAELLVLNRQEAGILAAKGETRRCRVLVPSTGAMTFMWYGAEKESASSAYHVALCPAGQTRALLNTDLACTTATQASNTMFVQPGVYDLTLTALVNKAPQYRMVVTYEPMAHIETERNDSAADAVPIAIGNAWHGNLDTKTDVDYYSFELKETSAVNAVFTAPGTGKASSTLFTFAVQDSAARALLCSVDVAGNQEKAETGKLYLAAGTYLIRVARGTGYTGAAYGVTVQASPAASTEAEPNDTLPAANEIPVDTVITGATGVTGDVDCFAFTLPQDALMRPRFGFQPMDTSGRAYRLTLLDQNRTELYRVNINGKEYAKEIGWMALTAGQYYLKVESFQPVRQDYTLRIDTKPVDAAEREPNNTAGQATELKIGPAYTGLLLTEEDVDYYKVSFQEETTVTLKFSFPEGTGKATRFVVSVEQNGKTLASWNMKENEGTFEQKVGFPAGEYYIRVKPSAWTGAVYTIQLRK